jgi:hypothetical protein
VLQPAPTWSGRATSLIRGVRGRPRVAIRSTGLGARAVPRGLLNATPATSRMHMQPGTSVWIKHRSPLHDAHPGYWPRLGRVTRSLTAPHLGAAGPKSGCVGLTTFAVVRELQLLLAGWAGACPVCLRRLPKSMNSW